MLDRRQHPRIPINECCILRVEDPAAIREHEGVVADVSETGMKVLVDHEVPEGLLVTVLLANHMVMASTIYCHREQGVYALGLKIEAASDELKALCRQGMAAVRSGLSESETGTKSYR